MQVPTNSWEIIWDDGRKKIILFDTTLRDGHQCPWAAIENDEDYFWVVRWLDKIWFDICEVWFPASSAHEAWRVNQVAEMCKAGEISTMVCWLSQMVDFQVDACLQALASAIEVQKGFFHIYFPVDPKLRLASIWDKVSDSQAVEDVARFSKMAYDMWAIVQFSPEGYSRVWDNFDFCTDLLITAAENGATYFNMPDTIWGEDQDNTSKEYYVDTIIRHKAILDQRFPGNNFIWSVHNHNDLWNAVQNSINGVRQWTGISKMETSINGVGERAGNADGCQIITRMKTTLANQFDIDHIVAKHISEVSQLVSKSMLPTQAHYAIVWANAMKHTSWWHANAILRNPTVYQPFDPSIVWWKIRLVYGPNSGGNLAIDIIQRQWYVCPREDKRALDEFLKQKMKETWRYKWVTDEELLDLYKEFRSPIKIIWYEKNKIDESNWVEITFDGKLFWEESVKLRGETAFTVLKDFLSEKIPGYSVKNFRSGSVELWSRSKAVTTVEIVNKETEEMTVWVWRDNDIETSSLKALANAFNEVFIDKHFKEKE